MLQDFRGTQEYLEIIDEALYRNISFLNGKFACQRSILYLITNIRVPVLLEQEFVTYNLVHFT
jgi:hypothetical protein